MPPRHLQFLLPTSEILLRELPASFKTLQPPPMSPPAQTPPLVIRSPKPPSLESPVTLWRPEPPPSPLPRPLVGPNLESPRLAQTIAPRPGGLVSIPPRLEYLHMDPPSAHPQYGRAPVTMATPVQTPASGRPRSHGFWEARALAAVGAPGARADFRQKNSPALSRAQPAGNCSPKKWGRSSERHAREMGLSRVPACYATILFLAQGSVSKCILGAVGECLLAGLQFPKCWTASKARVAL